MDQNVELAEAKRAQRVERARMVYGASAYMRQRQG